VDDFKAGESVVLTLADQPVLEEEGNSYALNQSDEMLENVNMAEDWRRQHAREMSTGGKYNPYGDNKNILGKYDEDAGRSTVQWGDHAHRCLLAHTACAQPASHVWL